MAPSKEEWWSQAEYDFGAAQAMLDSGRTVYAVFMCHLAIEKGLKAVYAKKLSQVPPKTHNLIFLLEKTGLVPDILLGKFLIQLNEASTVTRYPEDLGILIKTYSRPRTEEMLALGKKVMEWIKKQL